MFYQTEVPDWIGETVAEAIGALVYFEQGAVIEMTDHFRNVWKQGISSTMLNHLRGEIDHLLTEQGKNDPSYALKALSLRVNFNVQRKRTCASLQWVELAETVVFRGITGFTCAAGHNCDGLEMPVNDRLALPLSSCDKDWCACRWDHAL